MSDQNLADPQAIAQIREELKQLARLLREGDRLDTNSQNSLANLLDELGAELDPSAMPSDHTIHLAGLVSQLARSPYELHHAKFSKSVRDRLAVAVRWAEAHSPVTANIVSRFIDALASIGI